MSFTGAFTIAGAPGINRALLTDVSDYTDEPENTFSGRTITLLYTNGSSTSTSWPYSIGNTFSLTSVTRDSALALTINWTSLNPQPGSSYSSTLVVGFDSNNDEGEYAIEQAMTAQPDIVNDTNYLLQLFELQLENDNTAQAIYYQQQDEAQSSIDRATFILNNQLKLF